MSAVFTNELLAFPPDAPVGNMHIIDVNNFLKRVAEGPEGDVIVNLWDAVAAVLFKISPEILRQFLITETTVFRLQIDPRSDPKSHIIIWKHGNRMVVGHFVTVGDYRYVWPGIVECKENSGGWQYVHATSCGTSAPFAEEAWDDRIEVYGLFSKRTENEVKKRKAGDAFGQWLLVNRPWDKSLASWTFQVKQWEGERTLGSLFRGDGQEAPRAA